MEKRKELYKAIEANTLFDYIANNGYRFSNYDLVNIIKELAYCMYENGIKDSEVLENLKESLGDED